jgi:energy-coupling factor transporter ATP-binding protein EcfA2
MPILSFSYSNEVFNWKLNEVTLQDFNLLVGASGVGKSNILSSLQMIRLAGTQQSGGFYANGSEWTIKIRVADSIYEWSARISVSSAAALFRSRNELLPSDLPFFVREKLTKDGEDIASRDESGAIKFKEDTLPKLRNTDSVVSLLSNERLVTPLFHFLNGITFTESVNYTSGAQLVFADLELIPLQKAEEARLAFTTLDGLRSLKGAPLLLKSYILQENFPEEFQRLKEFYCDIFETVTDVKIGKVEELLPHSIADNTRFSGYLILGIRERGVSDWILSHFISDGMLRTLIHLFELEMLPPDSVVMVDEFEDGLGVNCLPAVTDLFLSHTDKQFILTSHHPYVINNVPWKYWKLVTRKGSEVMVIDATSIPDLDAASSLEKFTQLMNLEEYEEAIR